MMYIKKKTPPQAVRKAVAAIKRSQDWKSIPEDDTKAIRDQFDLLPKSEIRDALLEEQHYICAYCMKRIRNSDGFEMVHMTIEHFVPLSKDKERALDYNNYLGVCMGGKDVDGPSDRLLCCDASKGNEEGLTVNPLDESMMEYIAYKSDGTIYCLETAGDLTEQINDDLNKVLLLNGKLGQDTATGLVKGRRDAYLQARGIYERLAKKDRLTSAQISKKIREIEQMEKYPEFVGTILFFLKRKYKQLVRHEKVSSKSSNKHPKLP